MELTKGIPVALYGLYRVLHLDVLVAHECVGTGKLWVELQRTLEVDHSLLVLPPQAEVVPWRGQVVDVWEEIIVAG